MKTAIEMLEDVSAEIIENTSLLEVIYRTADMEPEADNAVACLIRSMQKTLEKAHGYIEMLAANPAPPSGYRAAMIYQISCLKLVLIAKTSKSWPLTFCRTIFQIRITVIHVFIWHQLFTIMPLRYATK